ncbi:transposase [Sinomonas flava]|uniref:transposase n=1 Tax=Sinomonas flava TaxID=496857 RepID=UPI0031D7CF2B
MVCAILCLAVEIADWRRFTGATIGSFVGLAPSEHSSGASRTQGPITKTGNAHVRRLGRGRLAPPGPLHGGEDDARPVGAGPGRGTGQGR